MRYHNLYIRALVDLGSTEAEAVLLRFLDDPDYFGEASVGLASLAKKHQSQSDTESFS